MKKILHPGVDMVQNENGDYLIHFSAPLVTITGKTYDNLDEYLRDIHSNIQNALNVIREEAIGLNTELKSPSILRDAGRPDTNIVKNPFSSISDMFKDEKRRVFGGPAKKPAKKKIAANAGAKNVSKIPFPEDTYSSSVFQGVSNQTDFPSSVDPSLVFSPNGGMMWSPIAQPKETKKEEPVQDNSARKKDVDLSDKVHWITQSPDWAACEKTCEKMIASIKNADYKVDPQGSGVAIQIAAETPITHAAINATPGFDAGIDYLNSELDKGHAVETGVNHTLKYAKTMYKNSDYGMNDPSGTPASTDHYVVIYGRGYDEDKKEYYYLFYDPGTTDKSAGASSENKLYLDENSKELKGKSQVHISDDKVYTVTQFRPNIAKQ